MTAPPRQVLIVSKDRPLLRQLSVFLEVAGYEVVQAADVPVALAALAAATPDFVIADGGLALHDGRELCRAVASQSRARYACFLLLLDERASRSSHVRDLLQAVEAGVDDFLAKPLVYGEVLARLRAGAEAIEFERSWSDQARLDAGTGLLTRAAFLARLRRELALAGLAGAPIACVVLELDYFDRVAAEHGRRAGQHALQRVAQYLKGACETAASLARLGADRFALFLPQTTADAAAEWAEQLRRGVAELEITLGDAPVALTASLGVAAASAGELTAESLLERATQAVESAGLSGRNLVVRDGEFDDEARDLTASMPAAKLFHRAVARDVMWPCALTLRNDECVGEAVAALAQTGLSALAVVDADGRVAGIVERDEWAHQAPLEDGFARQALEAVMKHDCVRLPDSTSLETLIDFLARDARTASMVIEQAGKPTGLVTRQSLKELVPLGIRG